MENIYDDEIMPENFEEMAKAYSKSLKKKGFVFVRLEEEEFNLLVEEVFVLIAKMQASLQRLQKVLDSDKLQDCLSFAQNELSQRFCGRKKYKFVCVEEENNAFLSLVSLENMLIIKLTSLAVKSEELELCNEIIISIASVFAESFSCEGFKV